MPYFYFSFSPLFIFYIYFQSLRPKEKFHENNE